MKELLCVIYIFLFLNACSLNTPKGPSDAELAKMSRFEKWASLKQGMLEEEVFRILGEPSEKSLFNGQKLYTFECFMCKVVISSSGKLLHWSTGDHKFK